MTINSEAQDIVDTVATENTDAGSQEIKEWGQEEAQETQTQDENQEPEKDPDPKPKKPHAQERIEQLAKENAELKRWRSEQESKQVKTEITRPIIDDFDDFSKYEDALEQYHLDKAEERVLAKLDARESTKSAHAKEVEFQSAISEIEESGIDFNTYAQRANELPQLPVTLDQFGLSAKDTLLLAKDLIDDEDTYIAISQMNAVQAAMKIGQIIESKKTKAPSAVSKAPKPLQPVKANASMTRDPAQMSDDEWYKTETQKRKGK